MTETVPSSGSLNESDCLALIFQPLWHAVFQGACPVGAMPGIRRFNKRG
ncbi:MAG: hypothetical protein AB7G24_00120 [Novosphingobium sp.]